MKIDSENIIFIAIGLVSLILIGVAIYLIIKAKRKSTCSTSNLSGTCPDGQSCVSGTCISNSICSTSNLSGTCPDGQSCGVDGTCQSQSLPSCTGTSYDCSNNSCTCPSSTPSCVGKTCQSQPLPSCTGTSYDCSNNSCTCPSSTPTCVDKICTSPTLPPCTGDSYDCGNNTCTCKSGFRCDITSDGHKCHNNEPITILGRYDTSHYELSTIDTDNLVNNNAQGQPKGCWGLNDPMFSGFIKPDGTAYRITSITVPSNMRVTSYMCNSGSGDQKYINMFKTDNLLTIYPPGSHTFLDASAGNKIYGFKFEYV